MRVRWFLITILLIFFTGMILSTHLVNKKMITEVDIVAVNELVKTVESSWGSLEQGDYSAIKQQFVVLDFHGNVRYQSAAGLSLTMNDAIKNRDTITDLSVNDILVGKLIIHNDYRILIQNNKKQLIIVGIITFSVLLIVQTMYILYLNQRVFKPFRRLQSFALHVARGNLDIPLNMDKNNVFGAFTESFDIMREELVAARQSEYVANRSKKELVASLSHDIKTPVASIKAVSELMLLRATDDKVIMQLNTIYSKSEQINLLITDMFHATLEELKELKVTVTEEHSHVLKGMITNVNHDEPIICDSLPDCIILTDVMRLQQVFDNILSNSYKYAGTSVTIQYHISQAYLEVRIMDYGDGINEDELPYIFNKFYRGNNVKGNNGSGLGLYISKYLMQSMQGDIECHNREDGFTVTLKIKLA